MRHVCARLGPWLNALQATAIGRLCILTLFTLTAWALAGATTDALPIIAIFGLTSTATIDGLLKDYIEDYVQEGVNNKNPFRDIIEERVKGLSRAASAEASWGRFLGGLRKKGGLFGRR